MGACQATGDKKFDYDSDEVAKAIQELKDLKDDLQKEVKQPLLKGYSASIVLRLPLLPLVLTEKSKQGSAK